MAPPAPAKAPGPGVPEDHDDVQNVYANFEMDDEHLAELTA